MLLSAVRCFELLSLSVLRECAEEQNQAKQSPGKSCTATRERTVSAVSGPMKSVPKREQGKADIQGVLSAFISEQGCCPSWASISALSASFEPKPQTVNIQRA